MRDPDALVGAVIDRRFRIEEIIGPGEKGGLVFRGQAIDSGLPTAIRCPGIPKELTGLDYEQALDTFVDQARDLSRASGASRDVEQLLAYGIAETAARAGARQQVPFCAFEWLEGTSLEQHLADRKGASQSLGEAIAILEPAARALASAHAIGIAHQDVRPGNLWLAKVDGRVRMKLTQFVLASRVGPSDDVFSPHYAAPEHFKRSYGAVSAYTDVYGLALCLVELVSGKKALEGADATELYLATSDLARRPTLRARGVQVSEAVEAVLARALSVDPKRRWQNARDLWDALLAAIPELAPAVGAYEPAISVRPPMMSIPPAEDARLPSAKPGPLAAPVLPPPPEPEDRSGRAAWTLVLVVGTLASIVVALSIVRATRARHAHLRDAGAASASVGADAAPSPSPSTSTSTSSSVGDSD